MELSALFHPRVIAVVGASHTPGKVGYQLFKNLKANKNLKVYPINPTSPEIQGVKTFALLTEVPEKPDVVLVAVPVVAVDGVIDACIEVKAGAVVVVTAGFAEAGEEGKKIQERMVAKLAHAHIPLLGPNTMGYVLPHDEIFASFGPSNIPTGKIAVLSQSGALLSVLFQEYASLNVGISFAVSLGNRAGINECSLLEHAEKDPHTKVIVLYIESFANIPEFMKIAARVSKTKPIFVLKGGSTELGAHASLSHTAALATPQALLDDAARQSGFVIASNLEQLVMASVVASKTSFLPENVAIITNAGGPSVLMTDAASLENLPLAKFTEDCKERLSDVLPGIHIANPLDLLGDAKADAFQSALRVLAREPGVDAIVCLVTQQAVTDLPGIVEALKEKHPKKTIFACFVGGNQLDTYRKDLRKAGVFVLNFPEEVVAVLALLRKTSVAQGKRPAVFTRIPTTPAKYSYPETYLDLQQLLEDFGFAFPKQMFVTHKDQVESLKHLKFPLVAKTTTLDLKHKANVGGVIQHIPDLAAARIAYEKVDAWGKQVVFQETVQNGIEVIVGAKNDQQFGWYMAVGLGGSNTNVLNDRSYIFLPAPKVVIQSAIQRTKLASLLTPQSLERLTTFLDKFQRGIMATRGITEIECNPVFLTKDGCIVADMKRV